MFDAFEVIRNADMKEYTTLKLGGPADYLAFPRSADEICALFREAGEHGMPVTVIGHGSNLLVLDGGIRGLVIRIGRNMSRIDVNGRILRAEAGTMLGTAALAAADAGLAGLEFACGIPGTVGGGTAMNAGAYDGEMAQVVISAEGVQPDGTRLQLNREELDFGYRHSSVSQRNMILTAVTFELKEDNREAIRARMSELNRRRAEKQPLDMPSAGSTFKRPEGYYAAALIDQCGLKGYSIGGARVSMKHAGFLVNTGDSANDFLTLMRYVQRIVRERADVQLEPEVRVIGEEA